MVTDVVILSDVGSRLRDERRRLRHNQEDFGALAGVTRQSQQNYESGQRPFPVNYLLALEPHDVDVVYVLTGRRSAEMLSEGQAQVVAYFDAIESSNQAALLQIVGSLAGKARPAVAIELPPERALIRMFEALLAGIDPDAPQEERALLLAKRLPIGLSQLQDLLPASATPVPGPVSAAALQHHSKQDRERAR